MTRHCVRVCLCVLKIAWLDFNGTEAEVLSIWNYCTLHDNTTEVFGNVLAYLLELVI